MLHRFRLAPFALVALALAACEPGAGGGGAEGGASDAAETQDSANSLAPVADPFASRDPAPGQRDDPAHADDRPRPLMRAQVILERLGFAPGVIDGQPGISTRNALAGFQEAKGLPRTGELDERTRAALAQWSAITATRVVTIPEDFARGPFTPLPEEPEQQARLPGLGYESLDEKLAERFHTTVAVLKELNPQIAGAGNSTVGDGTDKGEGKGAVTAGASVSSSPGFPEVPVFAAGQLIRVPNVGGDVVHAGKVDDPDWAATLRMLGVGSEQTRASSIVVSKGKGTLRAYDEGGKLIALFTVTTGSKHDPLPLGEWKINGKSYNPKFSYDPSLFWDVPDEKGEHLLPPGPNGPVGVVWIDLSKEHYGIHGTPEPEAVGRAQSHGCVRLTNWDAARLAQMVDGRTKVRFEA